MLAKERVAWFYLNFVILAPLAQQVRFDEIMKRIIEISEKAIAVRSAAGIL